MKIWITLTPLQKSVNSFSFWNFFIAFWVYFGLACISFLFVPLSMYVSLSISCVQVIHCVCLDCVSDCVCVMCPYYVCFFVCFIHVCKCSIICVWLCLTAWMGWFWLHYCLYGLSNWFLIHALLVFHCVCLTVCVMCPYLCMFVCLFHVCKCSIICVWLCLTAWMGWFWLCYCLYGLSNWFLIHDLLVFQCRLPMYGDVFRDANHLGRFEQAGIQRCALVRLLSCW